MAWIAIVALAGWTPEVRPGWLGLDRAHDLSVSALRLLGMSAGQPLFHTDASPWKQHAFCLYVRARNASGSGDLLFPADGKCHFEGFHPRLPPVDRALHRMLSSAYTLSLRGDSEAADAFPRAIGRSFCLAPHGAEGEALDGVDVAWIWYYKHYDTGKVLRHDGLFFSYACADGSLGQRRWEPSDAEMQGLWGTPSWR